MSESDYNGYVERARKICVEDGRKTNEFILDLGAAGEWIDDELKRRNMDDEKISDICFSFGQRCFFFRKPHQIWECAYGIVEDVKEALVNGRMTCHRSS